MSPAQRVVLVIGGLAFVVLSLCPPQQLVLQAEGLSGPYYAFRPLWDEGTQFPVVIPQLLIRYTIVAVITAVGYAVTKQKKPAS